MISIQGLICRQLKNQGKLPEKWNDLALDPARPPVPESLVLDKCMFYLDGIDNTGSGHSNNPSSWTSLKGSLTASKHGTPVWFDNHARLTTDSNYYTASPSVLPSARTDLTVEAVFRVIDEIDGTFNTVICDNKWAQGISLYTSQTGYLAFTTCSKYQYGGSTYTTLYGTQQFKAGQTIYMCARVSPESGKSIISSLGDSKFDSSIISVAGRFMSESSLYIGDRRQGFTSASGKSIDLYSFRIHNRALTDEEVYANMRYDQDRYNF